MPCFLKLQLFSLKSTCCACCAPSAMVSLSPRLALRPALDAPLQAVQIRLRDGRLAREALDLAPQTQYESTGISTESTPNQHLEIVKNVATETSRWSGHQMNFEFETRFRTLRIAVSETSRNFPVPRHFFPDGRRIDRNLIRFLELCHAEEHKPNC